ncbi:hypothetical protein BZA05DRAFT_476437 [Tricharina praecox]|uniref:uncharacterized protein n=1 Tax=Tricharina praecox TaxID=43433 RepID=UPI00221F9F9B|nr:uncharacterized protein BZA05DRAFT_476437 [Tricharina praecox]KAI5845488.1 hypothetical protein BZA05DRAFT_476437 [Tricharina praecox]
MPSTPSTSSNTVPKQLLVIPLVVPLRAQHRSLKLRLQPRHAAVPRPIPAARQRTSTISIPNHHLRENTHASLANGGRRLTSES